MKIHTFMGTTFLLYCSQCFAHEAASTLPETGLEGKAAITYHSDDATEPGTAWNIPGAFLGGESLPVEKGLVLDDLQLLGSYKVGDRYSVSAKLSSHRHGDETSLEVENFWLTFDASRFVNSSTIELGRITTDTTSTAYYHAAESVFGEAPLLSDVFFGRHFNDVGLKLKTSGDLFTAGLEGWNGDAWPASSGEGGGSIFAKTTPRFGNAAFELGVWAMTSEALGRTDERYDAGHSHGGEVIESPSTDIRFTGSTDMLGLFMSGEYNLGSITLIAEAEWIQSDSSGTISNDSNQESDFESEYEGSRALIGLRFNDHQLNVQYEELTLTNTFLDSIDVVFLNQTGLLNNGFDPNKLMVSWLWQLHPDFAFRAEWVDDQYSEELEETSRAAVGLIWNRRLF